jgi:hypothetical protein
LLDRAVAVPAIDPKLARVVGVAERNRLLEIVVLLRIVGRRIELHSGGKGGHGGDGDGREPEAEKAIGPTPKKLFHAGSLPIGVPLRLVWSLRDAAEKKRKEG